MSWIVKAMVFPVVMYGCEHWTKAEHQWSDAFELWCWRRPLSNQSILKEINPEYSLEGLMLKLQYFGHLMWRADWLEKTLILGKTEGRRRRGRQKMRWLDGIIDSMGSMVWANSRRQWRAGKPSTLQFIGPQRAGHDLVTEKQLDIHCSGHSFLSMCTCAHAHTQADKLDSVKKQIFTSL